MTDRSAEDVWHEALTPQQRLDLARGLPVTVKLTEKDAEILENDPMRLLINSAFSEAMSRQLDESLRRTSAT